VGVVLFSLLAVGFMASCILPGEKGDFLLELPPMRIPQLGNILVKTLARVEWYLREAVPLFFLGTFILFILVELGLLGVLEKAGEPVVGGWLGLPPRATEAFLIGFLRRDYGAAGLYRLFASGALTPAQALVSLVTITLFVPCIANLLVIVKEQGTKTALAVAAFIFPFAFIVGGAVRLLLELVPI
jgi:ferrous iron transport protein B